MRSSAEYSFFDISGPIAIVHRGGDAAGINKQNSIAAFQSAWDAGYIYAETDVVASADDIPLAFHGSSSIRIEAKTGLPLRSVIQSMIYSEIWREVSINGEHIPRLEEVLSSFPDMRFVIDPKTKEVVRPLAKLLRRMNAIDRVAIGGFSHKRTLGVIEQLGEHACTSHVALGATAFLGFGKLSKQFFERYQTDSLQIPHRLISPRIVERAHELGIKVVAWPYRPQHNDHRTYMDKMLSLGVDGLMSDHTHELKEAVLTYDSVNHSIRR